MSNETKRDVLKRALNFFVAAGLVRNINYGLERHQYISEYDAALPDDLPVIPEAVGDTIIKAKANGMTISDVFWRCVFDHGEVENWVNVNEHAEIVARAWLLGVWRVEGTGEIVKLEEEK